MSYQVIGKPWQFAGATNVTDCKTSEECMIKAGLDFEVDKTPLYAKIALDVNNPDDSLDKFNYHKKHDSEAHIHGSNLFVGCPNAYCTYRKDSDYPLGYVKSKYTIVQNKEAFAFFDKAVGANKAKWETAGFFGNGERVFVSAKLPEGIKVKGDDVDNYLLFVNSHDGSGGVKILFTPIRVVCQNTLAAALKCKTNYITFRHTSSVHKNIDIADEILGISKKFIEETNEAYNILANIQLTDDDVIDYICDINLSDEEKAKLASYKFNNHHIISGNKTVIDAIGLSTRKFNVIREMYAYYHYGIGQKEIKDTAWGAYNAVTGYYSNVDNARDAKRMDSLMFGDKSRKLINAVEYEFV